jgi:hypothetical protein
MVTNNFSMVEWHVHQEDINKFLDLSKNYSKKFKNLDLNNFASINNEMVSSMFSFSTAVFSLKMAVGLGLDVLSYKLYKSTKTNLLRCYRFSRNVYRIGKRYILNSVNKRCDPVPKFRGFPKFIRPFVFGKLFKYNLISGESFTGLLMSKIFKFVSYYPKRALAKSLMLSSVYKLNKEALTLGLKNKSAQRLLSVSRNIESRNSDLTSHDCSFSILVKKFRIVWKILKKSKQHNKILHVERYVRSFSLTGLVGSYLLSLLAVLSEDEDFGTPENLDDDSSTDGSDLITL